MATWNGERFLAEQLHSIANQSRPPDELVVSDDDSTDGTTTIVEAFGTQAPFRVILLRNPDRVGYIGNFQRALSACSGDLIALCDQDDVWHHSKLAVCERALSERPEALLLVHGARAVDAELRDIATDPAVRVRHTRLLQPGELRPFQRHWPGCMMVVRAKALGHGALETLSFHSHGPWRTLHDEWLSVVCGTLAPLLLISDELLLYRRHEATATLSWTGHRSLPSIAQSFPIAVALRHRWRSLGQAATRKGRRDALQTRKLRAEDRIRLLEGLKPLAAALGPVSTSALERSIHVHEQYASALGRRYDLEGETRLTLRVPRLAYHFLRGDYRSTAAGGLGAKSFLRDLILGSFG